MTDQKFDGTIVVKDKTNAEYIISDGNQQTSQIRK